MSTNLQAQQQRHAPNGSAQRSASRRGLRALAATCVALTAMLAIGVSPASAHASVTTVTPSPAAQLPAAPRVLSIRFNEPVTADAKRVQLLDAKGKIVATTYHSEEQGALQVLAPAKSLPAGLYALRWSVVSADGHVVTGASTFAIKTKAPSGKGTSITLTASGKKLSAVLTASRVGAMTLKAPSTLFVRAELKHKRLGATMTLPLVNGQAAVVLPFTGAWTLTLVEKTGTFTETRWLGSLTLR